MHKENLTDMKVQCSSIKAVAPGRTLKFGDTTVLKVLIFELLVNELTSN